MSNPSDNATFARTIKLLVANLDKTKERIQERFLQVDERLDEIEKLISSLQQNARPKSDDSTNILENQISDLSQKIAVMESQIKDLENSQKIVAPAPPASVVSESAKTTAPISATIPAAMAAPSPKVAPGIPPAPSPADIPSPESATAAPTPKTSSSPAPAPAPAPSSTPLSPPAIKGKIPPAPGPAPAPASTSAPAPAPKTSPAPAPVPGAKSGSAMPPPLTGIPPKKDTISIKDNKSEKDQLLEALKQLEGL
ncbi:MAG: hypothetical protein HeimC2_35830 [Candidatus Heimdallarchaeota archaeon LC_2]|nr:MAG: hypothetical protein HeimC2_35830 [Candidatus Heimdallarchaeota archaeon LC_2]